MAVDVSIPSWGDIASALYGSGSTANEPLVGARWTIRADVTTYQDSKVNSVPSSLNLLTYKGIGYLPVVSFDDAILYYNANRGDNAEFGIFTPLPTVNFYNANVNQESLNIVLFETDDYKIRNAVMKWWKIIDDEVKLSSNYAIPYRRIHEFTIMLEINVFAHDGTVATRCAVEVLPPLQSSETLDFAGTSAKGYRFNAVPVNISRIETGTSDDDRVGIKNMFYK